MHWQSLLNRVVPSLAVGLVVLALAGCGGSAPAPPAPLYPDTILFPLYTTRTARDGVIYVTLLGSPAFATMRDPDIAMAHLAFAVDPSLGAELIDSDEQKLANQYGWTGTYTFDIAGESLVIDVQIDGMAHTLSVADAEFSLPRGNCVRIVVSSEQVVTASQLEPVLVDDPGNVEQVIATFARSPGG